MGRSTARGAGERRCSGRWPGSVGGGCRSETKSALQRECSPRREALVIYRLCAETERRPKKINRKLSASAVQNKTLRLLIADDFTQNFKIVAGASGEVNIDYSYDVSPLFSCRAHSVNK